VSTGISAVRRPRQERARRTEARIVAAATELFLRHGYQATSVADIAARAGVAVQSLYVRFGGKREILAAALDAAIVGDTDPVPLLDRDWFTRLTRVETAASAVQVFVRELELILGRTHALYDVLLHAGDEMRPLLADNKAQRLQGVRAVASVIASKRGVAPGVRERDIADVLYALGSEEQYGLLVVERGWAPTLWRAWTTRVITEAITGGAARPAPRRT
jgi:AcrR family transcriptional regulator